jgi:hypothetical protein
MPPFQKLCGDCHVADVIIFPMGGVHCNAYCSKSTIQKLNFLRGSIVINNEPMLLTIEGKWLETIVRMTKFEFSDLPHP